MAEAAEFTYQDVAEHNTSKDLYMVIHDKVYDVTKFVDEHPYVFLPSPLCLCPPSPPPPLVVKKYLHMLVHMSYTLPVIAC